MNFEFTGKALYSNCAKASNGARSKGSAKMGDLGLEVEHFHSRFSWYPNFRMFGQ